MKLMPFKFFIQYLIVTVKRLKNIYVLCFLVLSVDTLFKVIHIINFIIQE